MNNDQPIMDLNYLQSLINSLHYKPYHYKGNGPATGILTFNQAKELCKRQGWIITISHRSNSENRPTIFVDNTIPFVKDLNDKEWLVETHEPSKAIDVDKVFDLVFKNITIIETLEEYINYRYGED